MIGLPRYYITGLLISIFYFLLGIFVSSKVIHVWLYLYTDDTKPPTNATTADARTSPTETATNIKVACIITYSSVGAGHAHMKLSNYKMYTSSFEDTWGKACDSFDYLRRSVPGELPVAQQHLATLLALGVEYDSYDYILFTDIKNYIFMNNLKEFLKNENENELKFYGHPKPLQYDNVKYIVDGTLVLSVKSLRKFVTSTKTNICLTIGLPDTEVLSLCLLYSGLSLVDTRDMYDKLTFLPGYSLETITSGMVPAAFNFTYPGYCSNLTCASDFPIAMSQVYNHDMYLIYFVSTKCRKKSFSSLHRSRGVVLKFNGTVLQSHL